MEQGRSIRDRRIKELECFLTLDCIVGKCKCSRKRYCLDRIRREGESLRAEHPKFATMASVHANNRAEISLLRGRIGELKSEIKRLQAVIDQGRD